MLECNRVVKRKITILTRMLVLLMLCVCAVLLLAQAATAQNTFLIDDNGRIVVLTTFTADPAVALREAGIELGEKDTYIVNDSGITVQRVQTVAVCRGGKMLLVTTSGETVGSLISRLGLLLTGEETVSVPMNAATYDGMVITVSKGSDTERTYTTSIPFKTVYCYDPSLSAGEMVVLIAGVEGQLLCTDSVHYIDGQEVSRVQTSQTVVRQPVNQVVAVGTGNVMLVSEETDLLNTPGMIRSGG